jgi:hypothetical protein
VKSHLVGGSPVSVVSVRSGDISQEKDTQVDSFNDIWRSGSIRTIS